MGRSYNSLQDVWDRTPKKLVILVLEASNLANKENAPPDAYVKIKYGKVKERTKIVKKNLNPVFGDREIFLLDIDDSDNEVKVSVWDKTTLSSEFLYVNTVRVPYIHRGEAVVPVPSMQPETVIDDWFELKARPDAKEKREQRISGKVHIRFYYSEIPETRSFKPEKHVFQYDKYDMNTGDLIAYSGVGLLATLSKLYSNSAISHLDILLY